MKNISMTLNLVLLLAVGFLYYKQYSGTTGQVVAETHENDSTPPPPPIAPMADLPNAAPVVFVNADSIFKHYAYAQKSKAAAESKVATYQRTYQAKVDAFQKEYTEYMEKAGAGGYSKEQGLAIEAGLQTKRDAILQMEQNQDRVMGDLEDSNTDVQVSIYEYLTRFNEKNGYNCVLAYTLTGGGVLGINKTLDVTAQVISGLNAEYNTKKK